MLKKILLLVFVSLLFVEATKEKSTATKEPALKLTKATKAKKVVQSELLYLTNNFVAFKEALAFKESQGKYKVVNTLGYLGKYQFGKNTLKRFKIYNTTNFLNTPELQEKAFVALCKVNKWILRREIKNSVNKVINGTLITESGILAAAHLSGAGNVKKYLRTSGTLKFKDAYGASIQYYMKKFAGYDVTNIIGNRKAKV